MVKTTSISFFLCVFWISVINIHETNGINFSAIIRGIRKQFIETEAMQSTPGSIVTNPGDVENDELTTPLFNETSDENITTTERTIESFENTLKHFAQNLILRALPVILEMDSKSKTKVKISPPCFFSYFRMYLGLKNMEPWAIQILDSFGKPSAGLTYGTGSALGDYDECMDAPWGGHRKNSYPSKYCLLEVRPPDFILGALKEYQISRGASYTDLGASKTFLGFLRQIRSNPDHLMYRIGICMAPRCTDTDVESIINAASVGLELPISLSYCDVKHNYEFHVHEVIILIFLSNIVIITVLGTFTHMFLNNECCYCCCRPIEPGPKASELKNRWRMSKFLEILSEFSLCHNTKKLLNCSPEGDALDVIRGLKVITVMLTIFAHTYALPHELHLFRFRNGLNIIKFIDQVLFAVVANASAAIDTFFFIGGFLFVYYRWRLLKKPTIGTYIFKFLGTTYFRMVAFQAFVIFIFALFPIFGSGPLWKGFVEKPLENCAKSWWMNILFIQNFLSPYDTCIYPSWILATMMQLFLLTAVIVWIMHKNPLVGITLNVVLILLAVFIVVIVTSLFDYPATFTMYIYDFRTSIPYWKYVYTQSYNHLGPFCIGMLAAYFISECPIQKLKKPFVVSLWIISFSVCSAIIFGLYQYRAYREMNKGLSIFYAALHRPAWALAMSWIVYGCSTNNGGFINSILSWKALIPLERLCYLAFLLHVPIMYFYGGMQRERIYMGHVAQVMAFFSYLMASFLLSLVFYLFFQAPYQTIESYLIGRPEENHCQVNSATISTETSRTPESEKQTEEVNCKVLFSRKF